MSLYLIMTRLNFMSNFLNKITPNLNVSAKMSWSTVRVYIRDFGAIKKTGQSCIRCKIWRLCLEFLNLIIHSCLFFTQYLTGVPIRIEEASRFEWSHRLHVSTRTCSSPSFSGEWVVLTPENFRISKPHYVISGVLGTIN